MEDKRYTFFDPISIWQRFRDLGVNRGDRMATSFFSEISYHFKRILSKIKFIWFGSRKFWFFFLLLFKIVILYFWQFLAFGFQVGWHHYFIHLPLAQKLGIDKFVKEVAITLLFIKTVAWLSLNPWMKYPKIINSDFFLAFSPLQNIVIIILWPVLSKNKKTKKKKIIIKVVKKS